MSSTIHDSDSAGAQAGLGEWAKSLPDMVGPLGPKFAIARQVAGRWIHARPEIPIALSFATGVFLGWLIKRR